MIIAGIVVGSVAAYLFVGACFSRIVYVIVPEFETGREIDRAAMRLDNVIVTTFTLCWPIVLATIIVYLALKQPINWISSFTRPASGRLFPQRRPRQRKEKQQTIEEGYPEVLKEVGRNESAGIAG